MNVLVISARRGLGFALSHMLADLGHRVYAGYREKVVGDGIVDGNGIICVQEATHDLRHSEHGTQPGVRIKEAV